METIKTTSTQRQVLVIDQDQDIVSEMHDYLAQMGEESLEFTFVKNLKEALKKTAEIKFDLIILEIILPIINGYYFLDHIKQSNGQVPVVVYTRLKGLQDLSRLATYEIENLFLKQLTKVDELMREVMAKPTKVDMSRRLIELQNILKTASDEGEERLTKVLQCPRCSTVLNRYSRFCNNCGQKIAKVATKSLQAQASTTKNSSDEIGLDDSASSPKVKAEDKPQVIPSNN